MNPCDLAILSAVQREMPLVPRPYEALARALDIPAEEIRRRIRALLSKGVIRRIVPMLDRARLGLRGMLVAAKVAPRSVARAAKVLDGHDEVTHDYLRAGRYNLWFTVTLRAGEGALPLIAELLAVPGVSAAVVLPTRKVFKLDATFAAAKPVVRRTPARRKTPVKLAAKDRAMLATLRERFPASARPWAEAGRRVNLGEGDVLRRLARLRRAGVLQSVRAALDQRKLGFAGNVLVAWRVPESRTDSVGRAFARRPEASHVVLRGASADWPYNLYTMVHARTLAAARRAVREMSTGSRVADYVELVTKRELKKTAPKYF